MRKNSKVIALFIFICIGVLILVPIQTKADSSYPNVVTTDAGNYQLVSTVDVNFHAGTLHGLIGSSPLSEFWDAVGLTQEEIDLNYHPVVYVNEASLVVADSDALQAKAAEIGAEPVVTYLHIFLFKQTTESVKILEYPNDVTYTIKLPSSLNSSEKEYAMICYYAGKMQLLKDTDENYSTLTFSTNKSAIYALVRAWDGTFDNIENGAYITDGIEVEAQATEAELDDVPKTGESMIFVYACIIALVTGVFYMYFKKKENRI